MEDMLRTLQSSLAKIKNDQRASYSQKKPPAKAYKAAVGEEYHAAAESPVHFALTARPTFTRCHLSDDADDAASDDPDADAVLYP